MLLVVASVAVIVNSMHQWLLTAGVTAPAFVALCTYFWYQVMARVSPVRFERAFSTSRLFYCSEKIIESRLIFLWPFFPQMVQILDRQKDLEAKVILGKAAWKARKAAEAANGGGGSGGVNGSGNVGGAVSSGALRVNNWTGGDLTGSAGNLAGSAGNLAGNGGSAGALSHLASGRVSGVRVSTTHPTPHYPPPTTTTRIPTGIPTPQPTPVPPRDSCFSLFLRL